MAVEIGIDASVSSFLRKIDTLSDAAASEAAEIARALDRGMRDGVTSVGRSVDGLAGKFDGFGDVAEKALKKLGGAGNEVADILFDFALPLGEMASGFGAAGAAAAAFGGSVVGIGIAAGVTAAAVVGIVEAATDARDRLVEQGQASEIPAEAIRSLALYESSVATLQGEVDQLVVTLGAELAPALTGVSVALTQVIRDTDSWTSSLGRSWDDLIDWTDDLQGSSTILGAFTVGLLQGVDAWYDNALAMAESDRQLRKLQALINEPPKGRIIADTGIDVMQEFIRDATGGEAKIGAVKTAAVEAAEAVGVLGDKFVTAGAGLREHFAQYVPKADAELQGLIVTAEEVGLALQGTTAKFGDATRQQLDALRAYTIGALADLAGGVQSITELVISSYEQRAAAGERLSEQEMRTANRIANVAKAAAIAQLSLNALIAWFQLTRDIGLIPGLAAGAPAIAAGIIAATMIAPAAQILGEPIPFASVGGGGGGGGEPNVPPTSVGPPPGENENIKEDGPVVSVNPGRPGAASRTQITLSRTAAQLLQIAPPGKTTRGVR